MSDGAESTSQAVTHSVRVSVRARFVPERSNPSDNEWFFAYTIEIANESDRTVQLLSRHWIITDADGKVEEVRGPGVVGQTPRLAPGQGFKYQSFCPLKSPWGTMEGEYEMRREDGSTFKAKVGRFFLTSPNAATR